VPLELSIVSDAKSNHITYDVCVPNDIAGGKLKTYLYQSKKIHGIPLKRSSVSSVVEAQLKFQKDLLSLCAEYVLQGKKTLVVYNKHLFKIMQALKIKSVMLPANPKTPTLNDLDRDYMSKFVCDIHDQNPVLHFRCSKRKAQHYFIWLTSSEMLYF